jgi:hypothetical protein
MICNREQFDNISLSMTTKMARQDPDPEKLALWIRIQPDTYFRITDPDPKE